MDEIKKVNARSKSDATVYCAYRFMKFSYDKEIGY